MTASARVQRAALPVAAAATFVAFLDVFALLPTIAPAASALGAEDLAIGAVVAAYSVGGLPGNVLGGRLADRLGRPGTAAGGLLGAGLALATYALAGSVAALLAARVVHGFAGGIAMPALFAAASDAVGRGRAGGAMGRLGATIGLAAIVGPATAGAVAAATGPPTVFLGVALLLVLGAALAWRIPAARAPAGRHEDHEPRPVDAVAPPGPGGAESERRSEDAPPAVRVATLRAAALLTIFGFTVALGVLTGYLPEAVAVRGGGDAVPGLLLTGFSLVAVALMLSPLVRRLRAESLAGPFVAGLVLIAVAMGVLAASGSLLVAGTAVLAVGVAFGLLFPASATAMTVEHASRRGRAFGRFHVAYGLGFIIGPPLSAGLAETLSTSPFAPAAGLGALVAAVVALLAARATPAGRQPRPAR